MAAMELLALAVHLWKLAFNNQPLLQSGMRLFKICALSDHRCTGLPTSRFWLTCSIAGCVGPDHLSILVCEDLIGL